MMNENNEPRQIDWSVLRRPFPENEVDKKPKITCPACVKKNCTEHKRSRCPECHQFITEAHMHINFVGHAGITARILEQDDDWHWEPLGVDENGLPKIINNNGNYSLWIKLYIGDHSKIGVGTVSLSNNRGDQVVEVEKELISDAIRNAAMRFGIGLELWSRDKAMTFPKRNRSTPEERPPVVISPNPVQTNISTTQLVSKINTAKTLNDMKEINLILRTQTEDIKQALRSNYQRKLAEIRAAQTGEHENVNTIENKPNGIDIAQTVEEVATTVPAAPDSGVNLLGRSKKTRTSTQEKTSQAE